MAQFVTLIVLLILAGVSISAVVGNQGIFKKAEQATEVYNRGKAREKLELTLTDAQVIKYTEGLTDEQLTNKINEIGEEIEERETPDISQAIVDGYIFSIDRTVPKILDYLGPADGIIITAKVSNNETNGWISAEESKVTITGTIKTYSGGKIKEVSAKRNSTTIKGFEIDKDGKYIIDNIADSGVYTIYAEDSKGKTNSKEINIEVKVDKTSPTIEAVNAIVEGRKIKLSATGHDKNAEGQEESGIDYFSYTVVPTDGVNPTSGTFKKNETVEITVTNWTIYTIKVTATDKCKNTTATAKEQTVDIRDTIAPTITEVRAEAVGLTIKLSATGHDKDETGQEGSGLKNFSYTVTPTNGLIDPTGIFKLGEEVTITSDTEETYTITVNAEDNAGNITNAGKQVTVTTVDGLTLAQAKKVLENGETLKNLIGTKIIDYTPTAGGTWRIFYYDKNNEFQDGAGTLYLKRDYDANKKMKLTKTATANGINRMNKMNPKWSKYSNNSSKTVETMTQDSEKATSWLCDSANWNNDYKTTSAIYAIGAPSIEMYIKAYNEWKQNDNALICEVTSQNTYSGYKVGANGVYESSCSGYYTKNNTIETGPANIFALPSGGSGYWISSPSAKSDYNVLYIDMQSSRIAYEYYSTGFGVCPIVAIPK